MNAYISESIPGNCVTMSLEKKVVGVNFPLICCDRGWEAAYLMNFPNDDSCDLLGGEDSLLYNCTGDAGLCLRESLIHELDWDLSGGLL